MYIRIQKQTIRYRISQEEAKQLLEGQLLSDFLPLLTDLNLVYSVATTIDESSFNYDLERNQMALKINKNQLLNETKNKPSKYGIEVKQILSVDKQISAFLTINIRK